VLQLGGGRAGDVVDDPLLISSSPEDEGGTSKGKKSSPGDTPKSSKPKKKDVSGLKGKGYKAAGWMGNYICQEVLDFGLENMQQLVQVRYVLKEYDLLPEAVGIFT
jgi:hypothetical protein